MFIKEITVGHCDGLQKVMVQAHKKACLGLRLGGSPICKEAGKGQSQLKKNLRIAGFLLQQSAE